MDCWINTEQFWLEHYQLTVHNTNPIWINEQLLLGTNVVHLSGVQCMEVDGEGDSFVSILTLNFII